MSTNVCGHFVMAQLPVLISLGIVVSCPTKTIVIVYPPAPKHPKFTAIKKKHSLESQVFAVFFFCLYHILWYSCLFVFSPAVKFEELQGIPTSLWFKQAPSSGGEENKKRRLLWFPVMSEIKIKNKKKPWPATSCYLSLGGSSEASGPTSPFPAAWWAYMLLLFLCVWFCRCRCCVSSVYCLNKALGRYLVFTVAQRRPRQDRSSGEGGQRGLLWGSPASGPARSPRRCLWWTDGPCSSWLL